MQHQFPTTSPTPTPEITPVSMTVPLVRTERVERRSISTGPSNSLPPAIPLRPSSGMVPRIVMAPLAVVQSAPAANRTNPPPNITHAGIHNLYVPEPLTDLSLNHLYASTITAGDISANAIRTDALTVAGEPYAPTSTWYQYPVPNGQAIHFIDICGNHILHAIDGDLYYDFELLAKAADIQDVADWALYPALQNVDMDGHALQYVSLLDLSGTAITASNGTVFANGVPLATVPALIDLSQNIFPTLNLHTQQIADISGRVFVLNHQLMDVSGRVAFQQQEITDVSGRVQILSQEIIAVAGDIANWANYSAVNNVNMNGNDIFNCSNFTAGGITKSFTLGSGPAPMLSANMYATNINIIGYAGTGNSIEIHGNNAVDIRSETDDINIIAAAGELNMTAGDVNITHTDLTSVMNITSAGPMVFGIGTAGTIDAIGGLSLNAGGAGNFAAGGALSLAGGDYVEINTGEIQCINTGSGQSLLSVNNIQGNSHNGGDGTLSLTGHSVSGTLDMTNHNIINVASLTANSISAQQISGTTFVSPINFEGGASIAAPTVGLATDLNMTSTTGSVSLTSSYAIYATAPEGLDMTNCDIVNLANINGVQYIPTEQWSTRPAVSNVQIAGYDISGANIVYANSVIIPTTGGGLSSYAGVPALTSGDAIYLQPKGGVFVQDATPAIPVPGSLNSGTLEATSLINAPKYIVQGPTPIALTHTDGQILDITDGAGNFEQVRAAALNLNSAGNDLVMFKQSATRVAVSDLINTETVAYLSDIPLASPLPAASFSSSANQTVSAANTPTIISHNTTDYNSGQFHLDISGNIVVDVSGVFEIIPSIQFNTSTGGAHVGYFWLRVNAADVANSTTAITVSNNNDATVGTVSFITPLNVGDVVKVVMASAEPTWQADANASQVAPYARPANPSIITTIKKLVSTTASSGPLTSLGGSGPSISMSQYILSVPIGTADMAAPTTTLGPVLGGAAYSVVGQHLSLTGSITQTGVAMPNVYTWNDGTNWYLDARLTNCTSSAIETWTINVQKSSTATLTNTIASP